MSTGYIQVNAITRGSEKMEEMELVKILKSELKQLQVDHWKCNNEKIQETIQEDMLLLLDAIVKLKNGIVA
ncbi:hypothetical protein [Chungangia koreensis]